MMLTKIAVTHEKGQVFPRLNQCLEFKIYETDGRRVIASHIASIKNFHHGSLAGFLKSMHVDSLICGTLGSHAKQTLGAVDITVYPGITGATDHAVASLLSGYLLHNQSRYQVCRDTKTTADLSRQVTISDSISKQAHHETF